MSACSSRWPHVGQPIWSQFLAENCAAIDCSIHWEHTLEAWLHLAVILTFGKRSRARVSRQMLHSLSFPSTVWVPRVVLLVANVLTVGTLDAVGIPLIGLLAATVLVATVLAVGPLPAELSVSRWLDISRPRRLSLKPISIGPLTVGRSMTELSRTGLLVVEPWAAKPPTAGWMILGRADTPTLPTDEPFLKEAVVWIDETTVDTAPPDSVPDWTLLTVFRRRDGGPVAINLRRASHALRCAPSSRVVPFGVNEASRWLAFKISFRSRNVRWWRCTTPSSRRSNSSLDPVLWRFILVGETPKWFKMAMISFRVQTFHTRPSWRMGTPALS